MAAGRVDIAVNVRHRQAQQALRSVAKEMRLMRKEIRLTNQQMRKMGKEGKMFNTMNKNIKSLGRSIKKFGGIKEKELSFKKQTEDAKGFALSMINLRDAGSAFVITAQQTQQAVSELVEEFRVWDQTLQETVTLTTASGQAIDNVLREQMGGAAEALAIELAADSKDIVTALREIVAMGFEGEEAMLLLRAGGLAAVAGLGEVVPTAELVVTSIRAFGREVEDANRVAAILTFIANETRLQMGDMATAMQFASAQAGIMGFDMAEVAATLGLMRDAGLEASRAGTSLRQFMIRIADPTSEARDLMNDLGIELTDSAGKFLSLRQIMTNVINATKDFTDAKRVQTIATLFEVRGQTALNLTQAQGVERLQFLTEGARQYENEQAAINFLGETTNKMLGSQAAALARSEEALRQQSRTMGEAIIPFQIALNEAGATFLSQLDRLPPIMKGPIGLLGTWGAAALQNVGQMFLWWTMLQTSNKQLGAMKIRLLGGMKSMLGFTAATKASTGSVFENAAATNLAGRNMQFLDAKTRTASASMTRFKFVAIAVGTAMAGVGLAMAAVNAESDSQRAILSALTGVMFGLAAASTVAAIARGGAAIPIVGAAIAAGALTAAVAGGLTFMASKQAEVERASREFAAQHGAFVSARPGRGVSMRVGEGTHSEIVAPEPMIRQIFRDELEAVIGNATIEHGVQMQGISTLSALHGFRLQQRVTKDTLNVSVSPFNRPDETEVRRWATLFDEFKRRRTRRK